MWRMQRKKQTLLQKGEENFENFSEVGWDCKWPDQNFAGLIVKGEGGVIKTV